MLYKLFPLSTEPRRCVVVGEEPPPVPKHTPVTLADAVRSAFPEMTVYEPKGKPFIVVQADIPIPRRDGRTIFRNPETGISRRHQFGKETHERRLQMGFNAIEAICRNENCRAESVAMRLEMTLEEKKEVLKRHGLGHMARRLTE